MKPKQEVTAEERIHRCIDLLRIRKIRITQARRAIIGTLCKCTVPLSVHEIFDKVSAVITTDISTVYRFTNHLLDNELLKAMPHPRLDIPGYVMHLPGETEDYVACTDCGSVEWIENLAELKKIEQELMQKLHFKATSHELRLTGVCEPCQKSNSEPEV